MHCCVMPHGCDSTKVHACRIVKRSAMKPTTPMSHCPGQDMLFLVDYIKAGGGDTAYSSSHKTRLYEGFRLSRLSRLCCTGLGKPGRQGQTVAKAERHSANPAAEADAVHQAMPSPSVEPVDPAPLVSEGKSQMQAATADAVALPATADMVDSKPCADVDSAVQERSAV